jgi:hypothetical protein
MMILHTSFKKTKPKKKPGWQQAQAEHDAWLKKHGVHPDQKKAKKVANEVYVPPKTTYRRETEKYPSLPFSGAPCTKPAEKVYTGTLIKGIGTMHKSNAVPIFSDEQAIDIATMRRN